MTDQMLFNGKGHIIKQMANNEMDLYNNEKKLSNMITIGMIFVTILFTYAMFCFWNLVMLTK